MDCWASESGGCGGKISREHLVTDGLWTGPDISVIGLPWCRTEPKSVGRANIVSKILCKTHNSALSELDSEAIRAFRALGELVALQERRRRFPSPPWIQICFGVNGDLLERWFLKTVINLVLVQQGDVLWHDGSRGRKPPLHLVDAAYGRGSLPLGAGLYAAATIGEAGSSEESVAFNPLFDDGDRFSGAILQFRGFRFLLSLRAGVLPQRISLVANPKDPWHASHLVHHIQRFRFALNGALSHFVYFDWSTRASAHYFDEIPPDPAP